MLGEFEHLFIAAAVGPERLPSLRLIRFNLSLAIFLAIAKTTLIILPLKQRLVAPELVAGWLAWYIVATARGVGRKVGQSCNG